MSIFNETTFKNFVTLQRGFDLPKQDRKEGEFPIVASTSVQGYHAEYKVKPPGVITGRSGSLGSVQYLDIPFWPLNTTLWVKNFKGNNPKFTYYFLKTLRLERYNSGAGVPTLNRNHLDALDVAIPPFPTQQKIAAILSAYDDLIENNLRRIKILEEMAQNLYREWFVKFRFPGHEQARLVDSPLGLIPEGWEVKKLGEILGLKYGKALKQENRREGNVPVYGSSGIVGYHDVHLVNGPGIVIGRKGNVGSVYWSEKSFYPIDTAYFVASEMPLRFLFYDLQTKNFLNNDAAVPGLNRNQAYSLETVIPPEDILLQFCCFADDFEQQAAVLRVQNTNLRRTRDMLLPKLISGEVDVSELDIFIPEEAVA